MTRATAIIIVLNIFIIEVIYLRFLKIQIDGLIAFSANLSGVISHSPFIAAKI